MSRDRGFLGQPAQHALGESRRCTATSKTTGQPCGAYAIHGGFVCGYHGGKAPQTVAAAKRRLVEMVDASLRYINRALETDETCDPVAMKAAQLVLDRAGLHPTLALRAETQPEAPWAEYLTDAEMEIVTGLIEKAKDRMARGEEPPLLLCDQNNDVVEAALPDRESLPGLATLTTGRDEDEG
jgi:hypothetical protein